MFALLIHQVLDLHSRVRELLDVYANAGEVVDERKLVDMLRDSHAQPISLLARWIVERRIVQVELAGRTYVPLFQFKPARMELRPVIAEVVRELRQSMDDLELAAWFVKPNAMLDGLRPVDVVDNEPALLRSAARAV